MDRSSLYRAVEGPPPPAEAGGSDMVVEGESKIGSREVEGGQLSNNS